MALPKLVCNVVVKIDDKYLLVQERQSDVYGKWNLPGGHVDEGETLEEAAIREAKEETNYDVKILKQLIVAKRPVDNVTLQAYLAEIIGGQLNFPKDEILDVSWFLYKDVLAMTKDLRDPDYIISALKIAEGVI